jgi:hypothetical protein
MFMSEIAYVVRGFLTVRNLERGGRVAGRYQRPPFTGCGWSTPLVNLLVAGPGNAAVIDLIPDATAG